MAFRQGGAPSDDRMTSGAGAVRAPGGGLPLVLALGGCMVGPNFQPPKVSVATSWQDTADQRVGTGATTYRDWWKTFGDPALDRLVEHAYRDNLTLRQAGARGPQARAPPGARLGVGL